MARSVTPQAVGRALSRAGFRSTKGSEWAHGFMASGLRPGKVSVTARAITEERVRDLVAEYANALRAVGYTVEVGTGGTTIFVS